MKQRECTSATYRIWIAGDYEETKRACREFTVRGLCVAVQPVDYVYTMGVESGVCVTLINYPRFPSEPESIKSIAIELGEFLLERLFQGSFTIEGPDVTTFFSRREGDQ